MFGFFRRKKTPPDPRMQRLEMLVGLITLMTPYLRSCLEGKHVIDLDKMRNAANERELENDGLGLVENTRTAIFIVSAYIKTVGKVYDTGLFDADDVISACANLITELYNLEPLKLADIEALEYARVLTLSVLPTMVEHQVTAMERNGKSPDPDLKSNLAEAKGFVTIESEALHDVMTAAVAVAEDVAAQYKANPKKRPRPPSTICDLVQANTD